MVPSRTWPGRGVRPGRRVGRRVEPGQPRVVEPQDRQRDAGHLQGRQERADEGTPHGHATPLQAGDRPAGDHGQLHRRRPPQPVDEQGDPIARGQAQVGREGVQQAVDQPVGRLDRGPPHAGLAVDAQAQLDLVAGQLEAGPAGRRHGAGRQRHAHGADGRGGGPGLLGDGAQVGPRLGRGAGDLVDQDRPGQPPAAGVVGRVGQGGVVGDDRHLDRDTLGPGHLGGQAEVEAVARVVLDDQQAARRAGDGADGGQDGVGTRGGEDVAGDGGREHAAADVAGVGRLVPAAAARDEGHPAASRLLGVVADQDMVAAQLAKPGKGAMGEAREAPASPSTISATTCSGRLLSFFMAGVPIRGEFDARPPGGGRIVRV